MQRTLSGLNQTGEIVIELQNRTTKEICSESLCVERWCEIVRSSSAIHMIRNQLKNS